LLSSKIFTAASDHAKIRLDCAEFLKCAVAGTLSGGRYTRLDPELVSDIKATGGIIQKLYK
jgi:hypothetical protein